MRTIDNFFTNIPINPSQDRQNKIQQLRKPVYSKKIKEKKNRRLFASTQFVAFSDLKSSINKAIQTSTSSFHKIKRSKSDLFLNKNKKRENSFNQQDKSIPIKDNLIIEKMEFDKATKKLQVSKNNFIRTLSQINFSGNIFSKNKHPKKIIIQNEAIQNEENSLLRSPNYQNTKKQQNAYTNQEKFSDRKQNLRAIELAKKEQMEQNIVNELILLRKRRHSSDQQTQNQQSSKKESLIRRNSLFLMNYLKQKEKKFDTNKSPHINFMRNTAQNIKIQQNTDLRKNMMNKINEKIVMRSKAEQQRSERMNRIFNTMKIDPWQS